MAFNRYSLSVGEYYVKEEGRFYEDQRALDVHISYLKKLQNKRQQVVRTLESIKDKKYTN